MRNGSSTTRPAIASACINLMTSPLAPKPTMLILSLGLVMPTAGSASVLGAEMPRQRYQVLHRMNFESPYIDMPHRLTVRQNLKVFGKLYAVEALGERIASIAEQLEL